tara:strand:+ start:1150 stop:2073 length:924 start_codon:yes stop_codon:yes gene_type:complete
MIISNFFKLFVSSFAIALSLYFLQVENIPILLKTVDSEFIFKLILINITSFILLGFRWDFLTKAHITNLSPKIFIQYMCSYIYNLISPSNLGGDAYRFLHLKKLQTNNVLITIFVKERFIGLSSIALLLTLSTFFFIYIGFDKIEYLHIQLVFFFSFFVFIISIYFNNNPKYILSLFSFIPFFKNLVINTESYNRSFFNINTAKILLLSIGAFLLRSTTILITSNQLGINPLLFEIIFISSVVEIIRFIPISIQGIGVREASYAIFFTYFGYSSEIGFTIGLLSYFILSISQFIFGLVGTILYIFYR